MDIMDIYIIMGKGLQMTPVSAIVIYMTIVIIMDIHMAMGIHMAMDIPMDMAIHMTTEMIMTTAMVLVIWASLLTKKYPRIFRNIINQLLRIMSYLFLHSLGPLPPTHTSILSKLHQQSLLLYMRERTKAMVMLKTSL